MSLLLLILLSPLVEASSQSTDENLPEVVELPVSRYPDPKCAYSVHRGNRTGPVVQHEIRVGEPLFHSWKCSYGIRDSPLYCLMVNKCTVTDRKESTRKIEIIDEFGCSLFPSILPHVAYDDDLSAGIGLNAFSLDVDHTAVFFECNIKMLLKLNGICRRPSCKPLNLFQRGSDQR